MLNIVIPTLLGTVLEWAEFTFFAYLATDIAKVFFPVSASGIELLYVFVVFAVSYLMRPLGAIIFGHLGDLYGRRKALSLSMFMMGVSTLLIAFLPSYQVIGILAPILLTVLRMLQGLAVAGEFNGANIFVVEHAKTNKAFWGSLVDSGAGLGMALGGLAATLVAASNYEHAWRIPFLLGALSCAITFYLRKKVAETPEFKVKPKTFPFLDVFKKHKINFLKAFLVATFIIVFVYICNIYFTTFLSAHAGLDNVQAKAIVTFAEFFTFFTVPIGGYLADKYGVIKVYKIGLILCAVSAYLLFYSALHLPSNYLYIFGAFFALADGIACGPALKYLFDLFPTSIRYTGNSFAWSLAAAIFGGTAPLLSELMIKQWHNLYLPMYYVIAIIVLNLFIINDKIDVLVPAMGTRIADMQNQLK